MSPGQESRNDLLALIKSEGLMGVHLSLAENLPGVFAYNVLKTKEADTLLLVHEVVEYIADSMTICSYLAMKEASYKMMNRLEPSLN